MNGLFVLLVLFLAKGSTHVCVALTKGLYPDGNGATTHCRMNSSFRLTFQHRPRLAWALSQTMHYPSPPNLHCFHPTQLTLLWTGASHRLVWFTVCGTLWVPRSTASLLYDTAFGQPTQLYTTLFKGYLLNKNVMLSEFQLMTLSAWVFSSAQSVFWQLAEVKNTWQKPTLHKKQQSITGSQSNCPGFR